MRHEMNNPCGLKLTFYDARLVGINQYLSVFPGVKESDKIWNTELNKILLNIIPNRCINQAYMQGFDYETITLKIL